YFASADGKGHYKIVNVPAGTYRITAWHERLPKLTQEITVKESGTAKMDFMMGIKNLPKP
ncbi:MAG: carboxypeptidase regulatory-like domain-containing protein, partial [Limisphaerales bacterium]